MWATTATIRSRTAVLYVSPMSVVGPTRLDDSLAGLSAVVCDAASGCFWLLGEAAHGDRAVGDACL